MRRADRRNLIILIITLSKLKAAASRPSCMPVEDRPTDAVARRLNWLPARGVATLVGYLSVSIVSPTKTKMSGSGGVRRKSRRTAKRAGDARTEGGRATRRPRPNDDDDDARRILIQRRLGSGLMTCSARRHDCNERTNDRTTSRRRADTGDCTGRRWPPPRQKDAERDRVVGNEYNVVLDVSSRPASVPSRTSDVIRRANRQSSSASAASPSTSLQNFSFKLTKCALFTQASRAGFSALIAKIVLAKLYR